MDFHITPMTPHAAEAIDQWHYQGLCAFYDLDQDSADREAFLNPDTWGERLYAVVSEDQDLIGFFSFDHEADTITLGLGLHPDYTGRGLGNSFVQAGLDFADQAFRPARFKLSVATFNRRAIRVYEQLGFTVEHVFLQQTNGGEYEFVEMSRPAQVDEKTTS